VVSVDGSGSDFDRVEKVILADERVALGARAFRRVKVYDTDVASDPILAKNGTGVPRFVIVSPDCKSVTVVEKTKLTTSGLWGAMTDAAAKFYAPSIDDAVKKTRDVLVEYDKIEGEKKVLESKKARLDEKANPSEQKEVDTRLAALEERQKKAQEKEQSIWELKPKV